MKRAWKCQCQGLNRRKLDHQMLDRSLVKRLRFVEAAMKTVFHDNVSEWQPEACEDVGEVVGSWSVTRPVSIVN